MGVSSQSTTRREGQQHKLHKKRFHLHITKTFFTVRMITLTPAGVCWSPITEGLYRGSLVGPGDLSRSPARACCVTREGPGAGVSLPVFNMVIRSLERSKMGPPKAPHTETSDPYKSLLLSQWVLWEDRGTDNSTIKMYFFFKTDWNFSVVFLCGNRIFERN